MAADPRTEPRVPAWLGALLVPAALVPLTVGAVVFARLAPAVDDVGLQLAGSRAAAQQVVGTAAGDFRAALHADYFLLAGYTLTLAAGGLLGAYVFTQHRKRRVAWAAAGAAVLAGACDVVENVLLQQGLDHLAAGPDLPFALATALATVKWLLLGVAVPVALVCLTVTLTRAGRAVLHGLRRGDALPAAAPQGQAGRDGQDGQEGDGGPAGQDPQAPEVVPPWPVAVAHGERWPPGARPHGPLEREARWRNGALVPPGRGDAELGFCVSGGGIRSACVSLGALQALRPWLLRARYLVSVSGGGYTVGAMQLALSGSAPGSGVKAPIDAALTSAEVLEPGSPEEDHLRRHSKYLADGTAQWLVALGVLLRGLLAGMALLLATVLVTGLALSWAYHLVPLTALDPLAAVGLRTPADATLPALDFRRPAVLAVLALLVCAVAGWLLWLLAFTTLGWKHKLPRTLRAVFQGSIGLALLLVAGVVVVPSIAWVAVRLQQGLEVGAPQTGAGVSLTVLVSYAAVLLGTLWRGRQRVGHGVAGLRAALSGSPQLTRAAVSTGIAQYLVVWAVLTLLAVVSLLALGWAIATGRSWPVGAQITLPAMLGLVGLNLDQTWLSLHPFYRLRLASAFAVRRATEPDGERLARPYDFAAEQTSLSWYGRRHDGFPQVIFAAAANLSGSDRTPPGRHAVSLTLSHDYVGGPDIGYAKTSCLEERTRRHIARDLTVQSAMAVSGAAFSSAMGRQARAFQRLFAVTNARLGTWLPNPAALATLWKPGRDWRFASQPAVRRLPYLLRELCGRYPMDDRFLLATDGGHYENLGLVELLRQGVRTAVCIDASGDTPPFATTLAQAITLAQEELGITITLHHPEALTPGSADPATAPASLLAQLGARLSASAVITGDILYPRELEIDGRPCGRHGTLVVARASLTADMPYQLHSYAVSHPVFPRDSTSDQWFDHSQFDAYQSLGQYLGERAAARLDAL
ncbi:hypothetical protein [Kitasatospora sp. NPDC050543]|uniref:hypothetical protein n=1 Tax=Kitasatospora sp. NPDC050543 TaxID=3364054 RepID=UPI003787FEB6